MFPGTMRSGRSWTSFKTSNILHIIIAWIIWKNHVAKIFKSVELLKFPALFLFEDATRKSTPHKLSPVIFNVTVCFWWKILKWVVFGDVKVKIWSLKVPKQGHKVFNPKYIYIYYCSWKFLARFLELTHVKLVNSDLQNNNYVAILAPYNLETITVLSVEGSAFWTNTNYI